MKKFLFKWRTEFIFAGIVLVMALTVFWICWRLEQHLHAPVLPCAAQTYYIAPYSGAIERCVKTHQESCGADLLCDDRTYHCATNYWEHCE